MVAELVPGFVRSGKVRDLFALDEDRLLLVASDRISAFDVVLPTPIPDKGRVLTGISRHWFAETARAGIMANHLLSVDVRDLPSEYAASADELRGRSMICRRADVLPVELIVRGYLAGSGWARRQIIIRPRSSSAVSSSTKPGGRSAGSVPSRWFSTMPAADVSANQ